MEDIKETESETDAPICYKCEHHKEVPGDFHSSCSNKTAKVTGDKYGIEKGWFAWPFSFDPTWLLKCDGFKEKNDKSC